VTDRTGHMGNTFPLSGGGVDAVRQFWARFGHDDVMVWIEVARGGHQPVWVVKSTLRGGLPLGSVSSPP